MNPRAIVALLMVLQACAMVVPTAEAATPALPPAARTLGGCLDTGSKLSVLMLIDESGSLQASDPDGQRVDGIRAALAGLGHVAEPTPDGRRRQVEVMFAGFYGAVDPPPAKGRWHAVTSTTLDGLIAQAGRYRNLNRGHDTDYATALSAARTILSQRAVEQSASGGPPLCTALIWFTDGRYQLSNRVANPEGLPTTVPYAPGIRLDADGAKRALAVGRQYLCRPDGLMDQLARNGVVTFTVGLAAKMKPEDGRFLNALTTGGPDGGACGSIRSQQTGYYLLAADSARLLFAFSGLFTGGSAIPPNPAGTCVPTACPAGYKRFTTVRGVSRFLMDAATGEAGVNIRLVSPAGVTRTLAPGGPARLAMGGATITQRWVSPKAVEIQGDFDSSASDWVGTWRFAFVDPTGTHKNARPYSRIQFFTNAQPTLVGSPKLIRGATNTLQIELAGADATDRRLLENARVSGTLIDPSTGRRRGLTVTGPDANGLYTGSVELPANVSAPYMNVDLLAGFTGPSGGSVAWSQRRIKVPTVLPPGGGYPLVTPLELTLGAIEGYGTTTGELTLHGSSISGGCAWIGGAQLTAPEGARPVAVKATPSSSSASCLHIGRGQTRTVTVRFDTGGVALGRVSGALPVHLRSDHVRGDREVSVPVSFEVTPVTNTTERWAIAIAFALLGTLIPLLLLHVLNVYSGRFPQPSRLRILEREVTLTREGGLQPRGGGAGPIKTHYQDDFTALTGSTRTRKLRLDGMDLQAVASGSFRDRVFSLFRGPYGVATGGDRPIAGGAARPLRSWRDGKSQEVPLALAGTWLFHTKPSDAPAPPTDGANGSAAALADEDPFDDLDAMLAGPTPGTAAPETNADPERQDGSRIDSVHGTLVLIIAEGGDINAGEKLLQDASARLTIMDRLFVPPPPAAAPAEPNGDDGPATGGLRSRFRHQRQSAATTPAGRGHSTYDDDSVVDPLTDELFGSRSGDGDGQNGPF